MEVLDSTPLFVSRLKLHIASRFENHVFHILKNKFPGCTVFEQFKLASGLIPDFVVECDRRINVIDAKAKEILKKNDVEQVIEYMLELEADSASIYVADFTEVPSKVEDYAVLNGIEIEYVNN